jgi:hypothetical protein
MFGFSNYQSANPFEQTGSVGLGSDYHASRKPLWLIALKLLGVAAMVAVGAAIAVPTLLELNLPLWQAIAYTAGGMCAYMAIGHFIRPEPNTDNLGWGGGLGNDPFKSSDNANRFLWRLHCLLGPGRFTAETFVDVFAFVGFAKGDEEQPAAERPAEAMVGFTPSSDSGGFDPTRPIAPLDPSRFALSSANSVMEKIQRDSQRYTVGSPPPAAAG